MQKIADEYLRSTLTIEPGNRLHRLVALLIDTWYDTLTDERIAELESRVESFRWLNANAERVDQ